MMGMGGGTAPAPDSSTTRWVQWTEPDRSTYNFAINATATADSPGAFLRIGHSLFALISGLLGGLLAWYWRRDRGPTEAPARAA